MKFSSLDVTMFAGATHIMPLEALLQRSRGTLLGWGLASYLLIICAPLAQAQSPVTFVKEFGLFGTWAGDCSAQPSPKNPYVIFSVTSRGHVELRSDFGSSYDDMIYRIVDARPIGHFRLSLRQLLVTDDRIALNTVMMRANDKIRLWSSRGDDGSVLVEDGEVRAVNGSETGWMERCDTKWTSRFNENEIRNPDARFSAADWRTCELVCQVDIIVDFPVLHGM